MVVLLLFIPLRIEETGSYFLAVAQSGGNSMTAGDWVAPETSINSLPTYETTASFNLSYNYSDSSSGVNHLNLWVSRNGGPYAQYNGSYAPGDVMNFDSSTVGGDGTYRFYSVGTDNFTPPNVEAAPAVPDATVVVDTSSPSVDLSVSGSWTKAVEEKVGNGSFESGNASSWTTAGQVAVLASETISPPATTVAPYEGGFMARVGQTSGTAGNYVWENRLMQSLSAGAKSLSLRYDLFSRDADPFDDPAFFIRLNGQEVFRRANLGSDGTVALNSGWQEWFYDLSSLTDPRANLAIYAGNTGDQAAQSWVYVDKVTTYFVSAPASASYNLSGSDGGSGIAYFEYRLDGGAWQQGAVFTVAGSGEHTVEYRSKDNAGNHSAVKLVRVVTDGTAPAAVSDLSISSIGANSVTLNWTAAGNDGGSGRAAEYDLRYSPAPITADNFAAATRVSKLPAPQEAGLTQQWEVGGLNPATTYYFALKTADEAPNWSAISNVILATATAGAAVNEGDVVINELAWAGSSVSWADEWLELRNMTNRTVDLGGFTLSKLSGGSETAMLTIPAGQTLGPGGYYLIASGNSFGANDSQLNVTPNLFDASLTLSNDTLQIKLYDSFGNLLDTAWDGTGPTEGLLETTPGQKKYYSMERTGVPGDGANPLNWYTSIDAASTADFFDGGADERGTPGAANRSENEPIGGPKAQRAGVGETQTARISTASAVLLSLDGELVATPAGTVQETVLSVATPSAELVVEPVVSATPSAAVAIEQASPSAVVTAAPAGPDTLPFSVSEPQTSTESAPVAEDRSSGSSGSVPARETQVQ